MELTSTEQKMLAGDYGKTVQKMMKIQVALGRIYGAERMIEIVNVHSPGVSYKVSGDAGLNFVKEASQDTVFKVPVTLNTIGVDEYAWKSIGFPEEFASRQKELSDAYIRMGAIPLNTCTPYLNGNIPSFGEHVAWGESSAVAFVNSVIGARTNREGGPAALAAAITGRVPAYGYHLNENRMGTHMVQVDMPLSGSKDYAVLGYYVGQLVGDGVPVFDGITARPDLESLKALSAALASSGAVALYHIVGVTPEARSINDVVGKTLPLIRFGPEEYAEVEKKFRKIGEVDFVVIGCPHVSIHEMAEIAGLLKGKTVNSELWVCSSRMVKELGDKMGYTDTIEAAGAHIICDTCPVLCYTLTERGYKSVATNSGKMAHYSPGLWKMEPIILDTAQCVQAALQGKWASEEENNDF